jgi:hypothetical protein
MHRQASPGAPAVQGLQKKLFFSFAFERPGLLGMQAKAGEKQSLFATSAPLCGEKPIADHTPP